MDVVCVKAAPVAVTVKRQLPVATPDLLVKVRMEDPLPGAATLSELKPAVTPVGSPDTESATEELKPPRAAVVSLNVPCALELTAALVMLGVNEKPGTFTATVCF
jgi:hypothetical protein